MNLPNMFLDDIDYDDSVKSDEIESVIKKSTPSHLHFALLIRLRSTTTTRNTSRY